MPNSIPSSLIPIHGRAERRNNHVVAYALVDAPDAARLSCYRWHLGGRRRLYAVTQLEGRTVLMHRVLLGHPPGRQVRHANADPLDNRRVNLVVPNSDSEAARSARRGISKSADFGDLGGLK